MNRKTFLINTGIAAAGTMLSADLLAASTAFNKNKYGLQLYSLRDELKSGVDVVFDKISKAGYNSVELFGFSAKSNYFGKTPQELAAMLKSSNLVSPSGHYNLDLFENDGQQTVDAALAVGHKYVVIPYLQESVRKTVDDYKVVAEKVNKAAALCKKNNLKMAYHNHDFEFKELEGGVRGYDILLKETDKALVDFELDLFWVVSAKQDPIELFKQSPGRFKMWHVKDMNKEDSKKQTEVGNGSIDFKKIFAKAKLSGLDYWYVEQENLPVPGDEKIKQSVDYMKKTILPGVK